MILGGFLERVVLPAGQEGIGALRVDPAEVKRQVPACTRGLSPMQAFGALKIPKDVGRCLVDRFPEDVSLAVAYAVGPADGYRIPRFDPDDVAVFKTRFTHPARVAEQYGLEVGVVINRLKRKGIRPVLPRAPGFQECLRCNRCKRAGVDWHYIAPGKPMRDTALSRASTAASATSSSTRSCSPACATPASRSALGNRTTTTPAHTPASGTSRRSSFPKRTGCKCEPLSPRIQCARHRYSRIPTFLVCT